MAMQGDNNKPTPTVTPPKVGQLGSAPAPEPKSQRELLGIITTAVSEVVNLKIMTIVSPVSIGGTLENPTVAFDQSQKVGAIATCINLLDGDITTAIDPAYGNADDPVRQYHEEQVKEAKEIVDRNLKLVAELIERLWDKLSE
ncbi:MAG: hypothetical protein ACREJ0_16535 [Geminicoccaceae bacterium]